MVDKLLPKLKDSMVKRVLSCHRKIVVPFTDDDYTSDKVKINPMRKLITDIVQKVTANPMEV